MLENHFCIDIYLFNELNCSLQVHTKVDELPLDTFFLVLLLLQYKHVVVEELLQTLIGVVDEQLLQGVQLKKIQIYRGSNQRVLVISLCGTHHKNI